MGYLTSGGGSGSDVDKQLAGLGLAASDFAQHEPEGGKGFLGNLLTPVTGAVGDIADFATGFTHLGKGIGSDVIGLFRGEAPDFTPAFLSHLIPGTVGYLGEAYGSPGKAATSVWEHPLRTFLDVYTGAHVVGKIKAKSALSKLPEAARDPATAAQYRHLASKTLPGVGEVVPDPATGGFGLLTAPGGISKRIQFSGGEPILKVKELSPNPVTRAAQKGISRLSSQPLEETTVARIAEGEKLLRGAPGKVKPLTGERMTLLPVAREVAEAERLLKFAREHGVTRLERPFVRARRVASAATEVVTGVRAAAYQGRNVHTARLANIFDKVFKTAAEIEQAPSRLQGIIHSKAIPANLRGSLTDGATWIKSPEAAKLLPPAEIAEGTRFFDELGAHAAEQRRAIAAAGNPPPGTAAHRELAALTEELAATEEVGRQLTEYIGTRRADQLGHAIDPHARAIAETKWARQELIAEGVRRGHLTYRSVMRTTYGPKEVFAQTASIDDVLNGPSRWGQMRDGFEASGAAQPVYFPHMDPFRFKASDWLAPSGSTRAAAATSAGPFKARKYWNQLNDRIAANPLEVYSRRDAQMRMLFALEDQVQGLRKNFGRRIARADDYNHATEVVWNPAGHRRLMSNVGEVNEALADAAQTGKRFETALGEALKRLDSTPEQVVAAMTEGMGEMYAIPKVAAKSMSALSTAQLGPWARLLWDTPTQAWRAAILSFSPRWIMNNTFGNTIFLKMQGGRLRDVAGVMSEDVKRWIGGKPVDSRMKILGPLFGSKRGAAINKIIDALPEHIRANIDQGFFSSSEQYITHSQMGMPRIPFATKGFQKANRASQRMMQFNAFVENSFRRASVIKGLENQAAMMAGLKRNGKLLTRNMATLEDLAANGFTEVRIGKAVEEMNYFFHDYKRLAPFERNVIRRFVAPFYNFYKHVTTLTLKYPFSHPQRALALRMFGEFAREVEPDLGLMPAWLEGAAQLPDGGFFSFRSGNPLSTVADVLQQPERAVGLLHPGIKAPIEAMTGRDMETGRAFTAPDVAAGFGGEQYRAIYDDGGNLIGVSEQPAIVRQGIGETIFQNFPLLELARDIVSAGRGQPTGARYSTGEVITDPETGEAKYPVSLGAEALKFAGIPIYDYDLPAYQERAAEQRRNAFTALARRFGYIPPPESDQERVSILGGS